MASKDWLGLIFLAMCALLIVLVFGVVRQQSVKPTIYHACGKNGYELYFSNKGGVTAYPGSGVCKP